MGGAKGSQKFLARVPKVRGGGGGSQGWLRGAMGGWVVAHRGGQQGGHAAQAQRGVAAQRPQSVALQAAQEGGQLPAPLRLGEAGGQQGQRLRAQRWGGGFVSGGGSTVNGGEKGGHHQWGHSVNGGTTPVGSVGPDSIIGAAVGEGPSISGGTAHPGGGSSSRDWGGVRGAGGGTEIKEEPKSKGGSRWFLWGSQCWRIIQAFFGGVPGIWGGGGAQKLGPPPLLHSPPPINKGVPRAWRAL